MSQIFSSNIWAGSRQDLGRIQVRLEPFLPPAPASGRGVPARPLADPGPPFLTIQAGDGAQAAVVLRLLPQPLQSSDPTLGHPDFLGEVFKR